MKKVLVPVYQPVVDMQTRRITYFEALARKVDGSDGHGRLIELGESYGFIHLVDLGILSQVIRVIEERPCVNVSVNVSVMTIENALGEFLSLVFAHMDVADRLVFEITETIKIRDYAKVHQFVEAVRLAGAKVAVDDFGDGYATIELVERIRPEFVKFPCSMVERLSQTGDVRPVTELRTKIEALGGAVIAEYVDSREKCELLRQAGVRHGQGFYFGRVRSHPACERTDCVPELAVCRDAGAEVMPSYVTAKCG